MINFELWQTDMTDVFTSLQAFNTHGHSGIASITVTLTPAEFRAVCVYVCVFPSVFMCMRAGLCVSLRICILIYQLCDCGAARPTTLTAFGRW